MAETEGSAEYERKQNFEIRHLSKDFGSHKVLRDIDFLVHPGDVTSIIGASGSGKSTLLRCINLLETPTSGEILFHGENIMACRGGAPAYPRQSRHGVPVLNLFDNMSVLRNCMVGQTKVLKKKQGRSRRKCHALFEKVGMDPYINARPRQPPAGRNSV